MKTKNTTKTNAPPTASTYLLRINTPEREAIWRHLTARCNGQRRIEKSGLIFSLLSGWLEQPPENPTA